jgi:hypothetical protein
MGGSRKLIIDTATDTLLSSLGIQDGITPTQNYLIQHFDVRTALEYFNDAIQTGNYETVFNKLRAFIIDVKKAGLSSDEWRDINITFAGGKTSTALTTTTTRAPILDTTWIEALIRFYTDEIDEDLRADVRAAVTNFLEILLYNVNAINKTRNPQKRDASTRRIIEQFEHLQSHSDFFGSAAETESVARNIWSEILQPLIAAKNEDGDGQFTEQLVKDQREITTMMEEMDIDSIDPHDIANPQHSMSTSAEMTSQNEMWREWAKYGIIFIAGSQIAMYGLERLNMWSAGAVSMVRFSTAAKVLINSCVKNMGHAVAWTIMTTVAKNVAPSTNIRWMDDVIRFGSCFLLSSYMGGMSSVIISMGMRQSLQIFYKLLNDKFGDLGPSTGKLGKFSGMTLTSAGLGAVMLYFGGQETMGEWTWALGAETITVMIDEFISCNETMRKLCEDSTFKSAFHYMLTVAAKSILGNPQGIWSMVWTKTFSIDAIFGNLTDTQQTSLIFAGLDVIRGMISRLVSHKAFMSKRKKTIFLVGIGLLVAVTNVLTDANLHLRMIPTMIITQQMHDTGRSIEVGNNELIMRTMKGCLLKGGYTTVNPKTGKQNMFCSYRTPQELHWARGNCSILETGCEDIWELREKIGENWSWIALQVGGAVLWDLFSNLGFQKCYACGEKKIIRSGAISLDCDETHIICESCTAILKRREVPNYDVARNCIIRITQIQKGSNSISYTVYNKIKKKEVGDFSSKIQYSDDGTPYFDDGSYKVTTKGSQFKFKMGEQYSPSTSTAELPVIQSIDDGMMESSKVVSNRKRVWCSQCKQWSYFYIYTLSNDAGADPSALLNVGVLNDYIYEMMLRTFPKKTSPNLQLMLLNNTSMMIYNYVKTLMKFNAECLGEYICTLGKAAVAGTAHPNHDISKYLTDNIWTKIDRLEPVDPIWLSIYAKIFEKINGLMFLMKGNEFCLTDVGGMDTEEKFINTYNEFWNDIILPMVKWSTAHATDALTKEAVREVIVDKKKKNLLPIGHEHLRLHPPPLPAPTIVERVIKNVVHKLLPAPPKPSTSLLQDSSWINDCTTLTLHIFDVRSEGRRNWVTKLSDKYNDNPMIKANIIHCLTVLSPVNPEDKLYKVYKIHDQKMYEEIKRMVEDLATKYQADIRPNTENDAIRLSYLMIKKSGFTNYVNLEDR